MATPYGLAYGIGAGLSGIPQAAIQGLGMNQQMQQRDLQIADMQRQQAEERALSEAVQSGASRGLGYGDIAKEAAAKGAGGIAILKLQEMAQKQQAAKREQALQNITRAMAFGRKDIVLDEMNSIGLPIADFDVEPDGQSVTISPVPGKSVKMPLTDAAAWIMEGKGMPQLLRLQDMQDKYRADIAEKEKKRDLEEKKFVYKSEVYDPAYLDILRKRAEKMGMRGSDATAFIKNVQFRVKAGASMDEAIAAESKSGDTPIKRMERARKIVSDERRMILGGYPNGLNAAVVASMKGNMREQALRDLEQVEQLTEELRELKGSPAATAPRPAATPKPLKPVGKITLD